MTYKFCPGCGVEFTTKIDNFMLPVKVLPNGPTMCSACVQGIICLWCYHDKDHCKCDAAPKPVCCPDCGSTKKHALNPAPPIPPKPDRPFLNTCQKTDDPPDFHFLDDPIVNESAASSTIHTNDLADGNETDFVGKTLHTDRLAELREKYRPITLDKDVKMLRSIFVQPIADINELLDMLERERIGADDRIDHCVLTINDLKADLVTAKGTADILLNGRADAMRNLFDQVDNLKAKPEKAEDARREACDWLDQAEEKIESLKAELVELRDKYTEDTNSDDAVIKSLKAQVKASQKRVEAISSQYFEAERSILSLKQTLEAKDKDLASATFTRRRHVSRIVDLEMERENYIKTEDK